MGSRTPVPSTFLLKPLIVSASRHRTSSACLANERPNATEQSEESTELRLKRFLCSGSKVPEELLAELVQKCREQEGFVDVVAEVFSSEVVVSHNIRCQFQCNLLKSLSSELEKSGVVVPDAMFDRLGILMGMKDGEFVERLYLDETGEKVLAKFSESVNQLSMGTTGLSVWQASCDLSNLFRLIPKDFQKIVELGSGCGVSGISIAKTHNCQVVLTDVDDNVLELLEQNAKANGLLEPGNEKSKVRCLDWCDFEFSDWKEPAELIIAADVVYDTALLASLCSVLRLLLREARAAIVACTRRNVSSLSCFEHHLKMAKLEVVEQIEYENGAYSFDDETFYPHPTIFPFHSTLKTPTIFYNIQPKK